MSKLPVGVNLKLKKIEEAESFSIQGDGKPILPNGVFVLIPEFEEETLGAVKSKLIIKPEQISTNSATYQEVAKWTISTKKAYLDALAFDSDTPATAQYRLTVNGVIIFADKKLQNILDIDIPENYDLRKANEILIEVKSDGATTIVVDGLIQGREVGE